MHLTTLLTLTFPLLTLCAPLEERQSSPLISLDITSPPFSVQYLQTLRLSYANSSAYLGGIKYQSYSEPLITNTPSAGADGLSFLSIHSSPTGYQQMYVVPHQSKPVGFSVPHGGAPAGVRTTGFSFGGDGGLLNNGRNLFYACATPELQAMHAWQVYWMAGRVPGGMTCKGPIKIVAGNGCAVGGG